MSSYELGRTPDDTDFCVSDKMEKMESKDRRDAIEAADATGMVAGQELISSFPAAELHAAAGESHPARQTIGALQAELERPSPNRATIEQHVGALRSVRELEAIVANWFDSPVIQRIIADLTQIGL
jgi:hypothetical protein